MKNSISDRANVAAWIVLNKKGVHVATVHALYAGAVSTDVQNRGDGPCVRSLETALKTGRITAKQLTAKTAAAPDYYGTDDSRRVWAAYDLFGSQVSRAGGGGYDRFAAAISGAIVDGHTIANHCGNVPEDESKRAALMRAYIADGKAGWQKGGKDNYRFWNDRAARIGASFANWMQSRADGKLEYRNYSPDVSRMASLHFVSGLERLGAFGYRVIKAI